MRAVLPLMMACTLWAQQPLAFEAVSVKPNTSGATGMSGRRGGVEYENISLRRLVQSAYRVKDFAYSGPSWLDSVHFDIVAKFPAGVNFDQLPEMLQTLLAVRFKLVVHREDKEMTGLALVVDKKGLRIQPVEPGPSGSSWGPSMASGTKITMAQLAGMLADSLNRPVKDMTGISGVYDVNLKWLPDGPLPADTSDMAGSVYAAVQDQLGLKLQVQKLPVSLLVVDRAERSPIEN